MLLLIEPYSPQVADPKTVSAKEIYCTVITEMDLQQFHNFKFYNSITCMKPRSDQKVHS